MQPKKKTAVRAEKKAASHSDLARLAGQAFNRLSWSEDLLKRCQSLKRKPVAHFQSVERLYEWFLTPISLWPFNIHDVLAAALDDLERGKPLRSDHRLLLSLLPPLPAEKAVLAATEHEHDVHAGRYEHLVKATDAKFLAEERELAGSKELRADWQRIKEAFPVSEYADHKGVVRRSMASERNLRQDFALDWSDPSQRFQATFDAFCAKWNLYGMQKNRPLLLKLSVNLTAFGTMIFIPSYWSLDFRRDFDTGAISRLHRARVPHRQGAAITENKLHRRKLAAKLRELDAEAKRSGLRGEKKHQFLCTGLSLHPETDAKQFSRLRKEFPESLT